MKKLGENLRNKLSVLLIVGVSIWGLFLNAHVGHDHSDKKGTIVGGQLTGKDGVIYLDAGKSITVGDTELNQWISSSNQIVYSTNHEKPELNDSQIEKINGDISLKIPGGEKLKAFEAKSAAQLPESVELISPTLNSEVVISKKNGLTISWKRIEDSSTIIQIIIEVLDVSKGQRTVAARMIVEARDDGMFFISPAHLTQLPMGPAEIKISRVRYGGFERPGEKSLFGVKAITSKVSAAKVVE